MKKIENNIALGLSPGNSILLGVNIDHIATLRNARGENDPSLLEAVFAVQMAGANSITVHLREDRRHIVDSDLPEIKKHAKIPLNFEMSLSQEILGIALNIKPRSVCLVPERRQEITTEGGLDIKSHLSRIKQITASLNQEGIETFLFLEPDISAIQMAAECGVTGIEFHTGAYARSYLNAFTREKELERLHSSAGIAFQSGLRIHAGHGLNYHNIHPVKNMPHLREVNIGHAIISRSIITGLQIAIEDMRNILDYP